MFLVVLFLVMMLCPEIIFLPFVIVADIMGKIGSCAPCDPQGKLRDSVAAVLLLVFGTLAIVIGGLLGVYVIPY